MNMELQTIEVPATVRTAETVALEIRTLQSQAQGVILSYAIEIGRRLEEAKAMVRHGEWGEWLKRELDYSQSTAQNFMRVYREYGDTQISMFGAPKSQALGNLTYTKALRLLAIPDEEERAQFVEDHDVESMSTRELEEAIRARDAAQKEAENAISAAVQASETVQKMQEELEEAADAVRTAEEEQIRLQEELEEAADAARTAKEEQMRLQEELDKLKGQQRELAGAAQAAREATKKEMAAKLDTAQKAAADRLKSVQAELDALKAKGPEIRELTPEEKAAMTADAVQQARDESAEQLRIMEKKLAAADPNISEFKVRYTAWQEEYSRMQALLARIAEMDAERAEKLKQAVRAALEQMKG